MGDRTFTAEDVLRIYADYLDESEMKTVEEFFGMPDPGAPIPVNVSGAIRSIDNLLKVLGSPLLDAILAVFSVTARAALFAASRALRDTRGILNNITDQGGVNA